jgi:hypothetical protein
METLVWIGVTLLIAVAVAFAAPYHHGIINDSTDRPENFA